jgi:hypothetical protein
MNILVLGASGKTGREGTISRADVADALLSALGDATTVRQSRVVTSRSLSPATDRGMSQRRGGPVRPKQLPQSLHIR